MLSIYKQDLGNFGTLNGNSLRIHWIGNFLMEPAYLLENLPRKMAYEKNEDESHAHSRQVVFKNPPAFVAMLNSSQLKPRIRKKK